MSVRTTVAIFLFAFLFPLPSNASAQPELQWDPPLSGVAAGYLVWYGTAAGTYSDSVDVGLVTAYGLPSLSEGMTHHFAVQAYDAENQLGELSTDVSLTTAPAPPTSLVAAVRSRHRIDLNWKAPGGLVSGYRVDVGSAVGKSDLATITTGTVTTLSMRNLPAGTYYTRVHSENIGGVSAPSNEVVALLVAAPPPPSTLVGAVSAGGLVDLSWRAPATTVLSYRVEVGSERGRSDVRKIDTALTTAALSDLPGGVYYIRVRSVDVGGVSSPSNYAVVEVIR